MDEQVPTDRPVAKPKARAARPPTTNLASAAAPEIWTAIGRLQEASRTHADDLAVVKGDISVLKREGERHTSQLAEISVAVAVVPRMAEHVALVGDALVKLEARPTMSQEAFDSFHGLAEEWSADKRAARLGQVDRIDVALAQILAERATAAKDLADAGAKALVATALKRMEDQRHAEVNAQILLVLLGSMGAVLTGVAILLASQANLYVQMGVVVVSVLGFAVFLRFTRDALLRIRTTPDVPAP